MMPKVEPLLSEQTPIAQPTTLLEMAEHGDTDGLLHWLVDERVDIRNNPPRTETGDSALHLAAHGGHMRAVVVLLGMGAKVNTFGQRLRTPLHCAAAHGHLAVAQRLLDAGAMVNAKDTDGVTALTLAAKKGHTEMVRLLVEKGGQLCDIPVPSMVSHGDKSLVELFIQKRMSVDTCDKDGEPLLVHAAKAKRWEVVQLLLEKGASATKCKNDKESALMYASSDNQVDVVRQMLRCGAAFNAQQVECALAKARRAAVVWAFVECVPNIVKNNSGGFALVCAGFQGCQETLVALLEVGVDINARDSKGMTALSHVASNGHLACVRELLWRGADVNAKQKTGDTPLHMAAVCDQLESVRALLAAGASVSEKNNEGKTPLDVARSNDVRRLFNSHSD